MDREQIKDALELADDTLRLVLKVYGPSRIVEITREKIAAALTQFQAPDTGHTEGPSRDTTSDPGSAAAPPKQPWEPWPNSYNPNNTTQLG